MREEFVAILAHSFHHNLALCFCKTKFHVGVLSLLRCVVTKALHDSQQYVPTWNRLLRHRFTSGLVHCAIKLEKVYEAQNVLISLLTLEKTLWRHDSCLWGKSLKHLA